MTPTRQRILLQGQTSIARKVYEGVPIQEMFTPAQIGHALARTSGAAVDMHILRGCLRALCEAGLVREVETNFFRRADVRDVPRTTKQEKPIMVMPKIAAAAPTPAPPREPPSAIDLLSDISTRLTAFADRTAREARELAGEIEATALQIEEIIQTNTRDLEKLKQLQALLKTL